MPFRQILKLVNFAIKNNMPGDPFHDSKSLLLDAVNQTLAPEAHADTIDAYVHNVVGYNYVMDVHAPFMHNDSFILLRFELIPQEQRWQIITRLVKKNGIQTEFHDFLKDHQICGSGAIFYLVWSTAHRANVDLVKKSLQIGQKVTMNTDNLAQLGEKLPSGTISLNNVRIQSGQWVYDDSPEEIVAEHLDELTVTGISEDGDVTFIESNRQIPFTLNAEESVAMLNL